MSPTTRPALRPGAALLRHDARHLRIGTAPGTVVADRPGLLALLRDADGTRTLAELRVLHPHAPADLTELMASGVLVDAAAWDHRRSVESRSVALSGVADALFRRGRLCVTLHDDGATQECSTTLRRLLTDSGVTRLDDPAPELLVVATNGEPRRRSLDDLVAAGVDHLLVRLVEDHVLVGPYVVPGRTPCIGCLDLHRTDRDPSWGAALPQLGVRSPHHNPAAPSTLVVHAAAVEAAAMVIARADHGTAPLSGGVLRIGPRHDDRTLTTERIHPRCACALLPPA